MFGADIDLGAWDSLPLRAVLFGEAQGRVVISSGEAERVLEIAARNGVPARVIGTVTELAEGFTIRAGGRVLQIGTEQAAAAYHEAIPRIMDAAPQSAAIEETEGVKV
jgi:phosphoribosylformylglycinamidine synthase